MYLPGKHARSEYHEILIAAIAPLKKSIIFIRAVIQRSLWLVDEAWELLVVPVAGQLGPECW
jgi:hypothetical protein